MKLLTTPHRADCNGSKILSRHVVRYTSFSYPILTGTEREVQIAKPNTGPRPASSIPIKQLSCAQLGAPEDAVTMAFCCKKKTGGEEIRNCYSSLSSHATNTRSSPQLLCFDTIGEARAMHCTTTNPTKWKARTVQNGAKLFLFFNLRSAKNNSIGRYLLYMATRDVNFNVRLVLMMLKLTTISEFVSSWTTNSQTQVRPLNLGSSMRAIMLCALPRWKIQANSKNRTKTFTNLVAMWLYRVSNSKSQFPHYDKGSIITLWSTLASNFTLIVNAACKTSNINQTPRV